VIAVEGEGLPERGEGVTETVPRLMVTRLAPQQGGERVAPVGLTGARPEIGQQGLGLPARQAQKRTGGPAGLETAEQPQL
jgi:hypothetical protein